MKVLIQNYSSFITTEPLYLNASINRTKCVNSYLWNTNHTSAFDAFDSVSPDLLICSYETPNLNDIFKYLSQNQKIDLVMNITGIDQNKLNLLESIMETKNITCKAFITNYHSAIQDIAPKKTRLINLLPAADLFMQPKIDIKYNIQAALISRGAMPLIQEKTKSYSTYHKIFFGDRFQNDFYDFACNIETVSKICENYEEVVLADDPKIIFSQIFFDSALRAKRTTIVSEKTDIVNKILSSLFHEEDGKEDISIIIKKQIKTKHNCLIRTAFLLNELGNKNAANILTDMSQAIQ